MAQNRSAIITYEDWVSEDNLMLLSCWSRDGYTYEDIANRIGITLGCLRNWRVEHPEIDKALKAGREIIDYKVENALLKSALGYKTKEVKVITTMRYGKVVETVKEVTESDKAPNVSAIQCWLFNRLPDKWKKNRDQILELEEDTNIQVTITRASDNESTNHNKPTQGSDEQNKEEQEDTEWQDEVNKSITVRGMTKEEKKQRDKEKAKQKKAKDKAKSNANATKVVAEPQDDLDYWPDDWEEE